MNSGSNPIDEIDFSALRVLVVGDMMLDHFRYGSVRRISPEAPVPVIRIEHETYMLGGAGNVAANLLTLGCRCALIAVVGKDRHGAACRQLLAEAGADADLLLEDEGRRTIVKTRLISVSQQLLRYDEEDLEPISAATETALIDRFDAQVANYHAIAVSDYSKGTLTGRVLRHIITRGRELGIPVVIDPKRSDFEAYSGATLIKPNLSELSAVSGLDCTDLTNCKRAADRVIEQTGAGILLTMAQNGMALFRKGQEAHHFPTVAAEVFDVSGAGDTVLATLCAMMAAGQTLDAAARISNVAAGTVVRKLGTATLTRMELIKALDAASLQAHYGLVTLDEARRVVADWKDEGLRVGFTNGCFDIVHAGHIAILREARARCDRLVVGLNSDASIKRLKGANRPIHTEHSRTQVLAAIKSVDLVVVFDDDTPLQLIEALLPSDLVKGADYSEDEVVGAKEVKAAGGRVHLIDIVPGHSTTAAVERILGGRTKSSLPITEGGLPNGSSEAMIEAGTPS